MPRTAKKPATSADTSAHFLRLEYRTASELQANPRNWRKHPKKQLDALKDVISEVGWAGVCLFNEATGRLIDGHARKEISGTDKIPVVIGFWTEEQEAKILATLDPLAAMAQADSDKLDALLRGVQTGSEAVGEMLKDLGRKAGCAWAKEQDAVKEDEVPEPPAEPISKPGDLWLLGEHRLLCGDSTKEEDVRRVMGGETPMCILTDPPYCSGGFQEAGRSAGSIGSDAKVVAEIANDRLSTRGYMALIKSAIGNTTVPMAYVFTDWRMWVNLFDVMESSGYGVRNMIVWDKGSPGMGMGWRTQHELVMFASRASVKFDNHKAQGNVIAIERTGNVNHPTEKPSRLLEKILAVTDMAGTLYDPFAGSGTTLIVAEQMKRRCFAIELDAKFCDVIVERWEKLTGKKAKREPAK